MSQKRFHQILSFGTILFVMLVSASKASAAVELWLVPDSSQCSPDTVHYPCYLSFQAAITNALDGDSLRILPGNYTFNAATSNVTVTKSMSAIFGDETARTILDGGGAGAILTVSNVPTSISIRNITFTNAATGILLNNSPAVRIANNIFTVGPSSTAVQTKTSSSALVINNTFFNNFTGIASDLTTLNITNNIFSQASGGTAITPSNMSLVAIQNNLFFGGTIGPPVVTVSTTPITSTDPNWLGNIWNLSPLFANTGQSDFHLQTGSPAINNGDSSGGSNPGETAKPDIGAYGGSNSDTIPFPVSGLVVTSVTGTSPATASLKWGPNLCYLVAGYFVYYGTASGQYGATPPDTLSTTPAFDLTGLVSKVTSTPTGIPVVTSSISNNAITISWPSVGSSGYEIRYDTSPGVIAPPAAPSSTTVVINAGSATSYTISGLQNGITYYFIVTPYDQTIYYIAVKAHYGDITEISSVFSNEVQVQLNDKLYGHPSAEIQDFPEAIVPLPNLPNKGCFIATAAYGYYSAPQVQALRAFRDQYLMASAPGRAFVEWYYRYGPIGAEFINAHPWTKPAVRIALLPAVGGALFMTQAPLAVKLLVMLCFVAIAVFAILRKKQVRAGGER